MPMYCTECGAENEEGAEFCTNCGAPLTDGIDAMTAGATTAMPAAAPAGLTAPAEAPAAASPRVGEKPATRRAVAIALLAAVVIAAGGGRAITSAFTGPTKSALRRNRLITRQNTPSMP